MLKLSATSLKDYKTCPYRWYFRERPPGFKVDTVPLVLGRVVHEVIENIEKSVYIDTTEATQDLTRKLGNELRAPDVEWTKWDMYGTTVSNAHKMLEMYLKEREGEVQQVEMRFEHLMKTADGIEYAIIGKIDQIVCRGDEVAVIDIKTGKWPPTIYDLLGDYQFQMYALAFYIEYGRLPDAVQNFHLRTGEYFNYAVSNETLLEFRHLLNQVVFELTTIKGAWQEHHKNKHYNCKSCGYKLDCYGLEA